MYGFIYKILKKYLKLGLVLSFMKKKYVSGYKIFFDEYMSIRCVVWCSIRFMIEGYLS